VHEATRIHGLVDHFFRHQAGTLVAVLTRIFGLHNLDLVEDVVQSALVSALESWRMHGPPEDPAAWMYRVARNKALDVIRRRQAAGRLSPEWQHLQGRHTADNVDRLFLSPEIADSQLRMIFTCCHAELPQESQVALTLKALCGFTTAEIARALLTTEDSVKKRVARAKRKFQDGSVSFEVPSGAQLPERIGSVHTVLYLLFNEGYSSSKPDELIRRDLCEEAARLCLLLYEHPVSRNRSSAALLALMLLHASRFGARLGADGSILLLDEQDRRLWDRELIASGLHYLSCSAEDERLTPYHVEAAIAAQHAIAPSFEQTHWQAILDLYNHLNRLSPSPIHQLNRAIVVAQIAGPQAGLAALEAITDAGPLQDYHLFHATAGELHRRAGHHELARVSLKRALHCTVSVAERRLLERRLRQCDTIQPV
jgi:RNA polymerase sigma-70 factor (ECF subfamily)